MLIRGLLSCLSKEGEDGPGDSKAQHRGVGDEGTVQSCNIRMKTSGQCSKGFLWGGVYDILLSGAIHKHLSCHCKIADSNPD